MDPLSGPDSILRFGVFELDSRSGELRKNGVQIKVQESPLRALRLLLAHPQQVLTRQEFRQALWGEDVFVDFDRAINTTINRLRETLNDVSSNPVFIETVARSGYRWIAPVHVVPGVEEMAKADDIAPPAIAATGNLAVERSVYSEARLFWTVASVAGMCALLVLAMAWKRFHQAPVVHSHESADAAGLRKAHDLKAEQFYLTGRYYWSKRTPEDLRRAADAFTQAIVQDPSYAKAYVGLADTYDLMREYASMPDAEAYPRAYDAASKAIELDDSSAEAHAALGFVSFWWKRDAKLADREFQRALALNPSYVNAYLWYANILGCQGRNAEQLQRLNRAQELDPGSPSIRADKGQAFLLTGEREQGLALLKQLEASDPAFTSPHLYLSEFYLAEFDARDYLVEAHLTSRLRARPDDLLVEQAAEKGFAAGGVAGMLSSILEIQKKLYSEHRLSAYEVAQTEALLGHHDAALHYLDIALQRNESELSGLRVDLAFRNWHGTPQFQQLLTRAGLPPFS